MTRGKRHGNIWRHHEVLILLFLVVQQFQANLRGQQKESCFDCTRGLRLSPSQTSPSEADPSMRWPLALVTRTSAIVAKRNKSCVMPVIRAGEPIILWISRRNMRRPRDPNKSREYTPGKHAYASQLAWFEMRRSYVDSGTDYFRLV
jgi:hypothetical protein